MMRRLLNAFYYFCILFLIIFWVAVSNNTIEQHMFFAKTCVTLSWIVVSVTLIDLAFGKPNSKS